MYVTMVNFVSSKTDWQCCVIDLAFKIGFGTVKALICQSIISQLFKWYLPWDWKKIFGVKVPVCTWLQLILWMLGVKPAAWDSTEEFTRKKITKWNLNFNISSSREEENFCGEHENNPCYFSCLQSRSELNITSKV
jgi:hypothetical protein